MSGLGASPVDEERRYNQWLAVMETYNPGFDQKKYWSYGCNCLSLGDRPLSGQGFGIPVDALDGTCKKYKDCMRCAKEEYGKDCTNENTRYNFAVQGNEVICTDNPRNDKAGCKRKICECDKQFAQDHILVKDVFNKQYHSFYADPPFKPETECARKVQPGGNLKCCGAKSSYSVLYSANNKQCCPGGEVRDVGSC